MTVADERDSAPKILTLHLVVAAVLSFLAPGLGGSYLGMPSTESTWQMRSKMLPVTLLIAWVVITIHDVNLLFVALFAGFWFVVIGKNVVAKEWKWAVTHPNLVRIAPTDQEFGSAISFCIVITLVFVGSDIQMPTFFRAPNATPLVDKGDLLYGFRYEESRISVTRGQLLLAKIDDQIALVRVVGVPGDIVGVGSYMIQVNGNVVHLKLSAELTKDSAQSEMTDLAKELAYPSQQGMVTKVVANSVAVRGKEPVILGQDNYLVSFDNDLLIPRQDIAPTQVIASRDIVIVPWAPFSLLGSVPGDASGIAQPNIVFVD